MKTWLAEISKRMDDFRFDKIKIYFWWNDFSQPFFGFTHQCLRFSTRFKFARGDRKWYFAYTFPPLAIYQ